MGPGKFDPTQPGELLKHMDKQKELLTKTREIMMNELRNLQVEEELLMRKLYKVRSGHVFTKQSITGRPDVDRRYKGNSNASHNSAGGEQSNEEVSAVHEQ